MFSSGPTNAYGAASMEPTVTSLTATSFITSGQITADMIDATIDVSAPVGNFTNLNCTGVTASGGIQGGTVTSTGLLTGTAGAAVGTLTAASPPRNPALNLYHASTDHPLASYLICRNSNGDAIRSIDQSAQTKTKLTVDQVALGTGGLSTAGGPITTNSLGGFITASALITANGGLTTPSSIATTTTKFNSYYRWRHNYCMRPDQQVGSQHQVQ